MALAPAPVPAGVRVTEVRTRAERTAFVNLPFRLYADDAAWVPPLRGEVHALLTPGRNPWFEHATAAFLIARRGTRVTGRISAQVDRLVQAMPVDQGGGSDVGHWGMFEAEDPETAAALIAAAEDWLRRRGVRQAMGPFSLSVWDEPGLLVDGHDHPPTVMMGHHLPAYESYLTAAGYTGVKDLYCYELDITEDLPPLIQRIITSGERNGRITVRKVDRRRFAEEAAIILGILNDAWSDNWGYVPLTDAEIAHAGKKLKPVVFEDLIMIAEVEGEPVAFMMTLPDLNELTADLNGRLFPFGFAKLLWRLRKPRVRTMRVPLMGVVKRMQATRLASQLAFMMIEYIRRASVANYGATRSEIGWILEDNQGMRSIAHALKTRINKTYRIYQRSI
ncbi:N-acetyltransferase [Sphingomonas montana]|uniref:N-acetyltransferase n=1 Tax=Sphingomonas montana TaxID=1843236 RepID=UPI00096DE7C9|nr:N-acetyltransferase [Sphingomonas montana]